MNHSASAHTCNNENISSTDPSILQDASFNGIHSDFIQEGDLPFPLLDFPSPFIDYNEDGELDADVLAQNHQNLLLEHEEMSPSRYIVASPIIFGTDESIRYPGTGENHVAANPIPFGTEESIIGYSGTGENHGAVGKTVPIRKRASKNDRHSKISTSRGVRDRRIRLSLDVAREFFDLQEILGFDKASKTIRWLLTKSKLAIGELTGQSTENKNNCGSISPLSAFSRMNCEMRSKTNHTCRGNLRERVTGKDERKIKQSRRIAFCPVARESRAKARERAKMRTWEKMTLQTTIEEADRHLGKQMESDLWNFGFQSNGSDEAGEESGAQLVRRIKVNLGHLQVQSDEGGSHSDHMKHIEANKDGVDADDLSKIVRSWSTASSHFERLHNGQD